MHAGYVILQFYVNLLGPWEGGGIFQILSDGKVQFITNQYLR